VIFHADMALHQLPAIYAECGIFAFPTLADTWGVVVNEALAAGLPVLGSVYSQAVEELIEEGQTGWTFHPDHNGDTYSALERALNTSVDELNSMRQRARAKAMLYTPETVADNIARAVSRMVSET
jgi:glycosyltransferase involved in cell wall biosynthesis